MLNLKILWRTLPTDWESHHGHLYSNELLTWHALESGVLREYKVCDFGSAGHPAERYGVRCSEAMFGGDTVCFGRNACVHSTLLFRLSTWGYRVRYRWLQIPASLRYASVR